MASNVVAAGFESNRQAFLLSIAFLGLSKPSITEIKKLRMFLIRTIKLTSSV